jgi:hypothetical protein
MHKWTNTLAFVVLTLSCGPSVAHAGPVNDPDLKFSLVIPDGFVRDQQLAAARPDFLYAFRKTEPQDVGVVIIIERMRGTIGRERLNTSKRPAGFAGRVFAVRWRDFDIDAIEVPEEVNGIETVNFNVQVPLKPEAIQIRVVGRRDQKDQLLQLTNNLLASLQGDSNWLGTSAPPALARWSGYGSLTLAVCGISVITGLVVLWLVRRVSRRGTVLGLAVLIYAASWMIGPGETREMRGLVGVVRMLGVLGSLLGLFDLFRHPVAKRPAERPPAAADRPGV